MPKTFARGVVRAALPTRHDRDASSAQAAALTPSARLNLACVLSLLVAIALVFAQSVDFGFSSWDDPKYVTGNPRVLMGLSLDGVQWAFTTRHFGLWHPLTWLSHMLDVSLWGDWAGGHHLSSVAFHAAATILLFAFLRQATGSPLRALVVSMLFAVHPLRAESVAWVAERKDVLAAMFWMATLYFYRRWASAKRWRDSLAVVACFVLGGLSKPVVVTLPVVLMLVDLWPLRRFDFSVAPARAIWQSASEKLHLFLMALGLATYTLQHSGETGLRELDPQAFFSLAERLQIAAMAYGEYLWKTVWPVSLSFYHAARFPIPPVAWLAPLALLGLSAALLWKHRRERPELIMGLSWYCITLLPSSGIIQIGFYSHADRYGYIPLVGIYICLAWAVRDIPQGARARAVMAAGLLAAIAPMIALAHWQVSHWRSGFTLYGRALEIDPQNRMARIALSHAHLAAGNYAEVRKHTDILLAARPPDHFSAIAELYRGDAAHFEGRHDLAAQAWHASAAIDPAYWRAQLRLGSLALGEGRLADAATHLQLADRLNPRNVEVLNNLGVVRVRANDQRGARDAYRRAVDADPTSVTARLNLARTHERLGDRAAALDEYRQALRLEPENAVTVAAIRRLVGGSH